MAESTDFSSPARQQKDRGARPWRLDLVAHQQAALGMAAAMFQTQPPKESLQSTGESPLPVRLAGHGRRARRPWARSCSSRRPASAVKCLARTTQVHICQHRALFSYGVLIHSREIRGLRAECCTRRELRLAGRGTLVFVRGPPGRHIHRQTRCPTLASLALSSSDMMAPLGPRAEACKPWQSRRPPW